MLFVVLPYSFAHLLLYHFVCVQPDSLNDVVNVKLRERLMTVLKLAQTHKIKRFTGCDCDIFKCTDIQEH